MSAPARRGERTDAERPARIAAAETEGLALDRFLPYRLAVLAHAVSRALSDIYRDRFGLTIPEWRVIANLGRHEPMSSNRIAERGSMDKAKVSRAVSRLVQAGLVTRETDNRDNRLIVLRLSTEGRRVYHDIAPLALAWEEDLMDCLSEDEKTALDAALSKLQARAEELRERG